MAEQDVADLGGGHAEELAVEVDEVGAPAGELMVEAGFEADGVVAEN
jgi:hypothetical protein